MPNAHCVWTSETGRCIDDIWGRSDTDWLQYASSILVNAPKQVSSSLQFKDARHLDSSEYYLKCNYDENTWNCNREKKKVIWKTMFIKSTQMISYLSNYRKVGYI